MNSSISTIINFCSYNSRFIGPCIEQAQKVSKHVIISVCDQLYNGQKEDPQLLASLYAQYPNCQFVQFPFVPKLAKVYGTQLWVTLARWLALQEVPLSSDYVLLLDADEIIDGPRFKQWLNQYDYRKHTVLPFDAYWYFREVHIRAKQTEYAGTLARREALEAKHLFRFMDRRALHPLEKNLKLHKGCDNKPLIHHYAWVQTKQEMLQKTATWGHNRERNWSKIIEQEFEHEPGNKDFVHAYDLQSVEPFISPAEILQNPQATKMDHVNTLSIEQLQAQIDKIPWSNLLHFRFNPRQYLTVARKKLQRLFP